MFAVCSPDGDIDLERNPGHGLYFDDTRYLDRAVLRLDGQPLGVLLAQSNGDHSISELANADIQLRSTGRLSKDRIAIQRIRRLGRRVRETISVRSYASRRVRFDLTLELGSKFADIFMVRGARSGRRGRIQTPRCEDDRLTLAYDGADGFRRSTVITFHPRPAACRAGVARYAVDLAPHQSITLEFDIELKDEGRRAFKNRPSRQTAGTPYGSVAVETDNDLFNRCLARSFTDLRMLLMTERGLDFFSAGVPWYVALFGRDSLITSLEAMPFGTRVAAETLRLLASYQGRRHDESRDEQPGKIPHELRVGERANLQEPPPSPYYGTVDATPLFLIVLGEYVRWSGDLALFEELRANVHRALEWIERWGDSDGDGLVDYQAGSSHGFRNQGWKDSDNSIVNADGSLAEPPVALIEVQGYVYRAWLETARLMRATGDSDCAARLESAASGMKERVAQAYWDDRRSYPAMAVQRGGRPAGAVASNPGQALWSGVVGAERDGSLADTLLSESMFSGWGVRTLSSAERAYNPIDYQVGAVWPHDTALIMAGLKWAGRHEAADALFTGMFDAAATFPHYRLPELFAGYSRKDYAVPVRYPVACNPQAWAAGALPYMLATMLGFEPDAAAGRLAIRRPRLPQWLREVTVRRLAVGRATADLRFRRSGRKTSVSVLDVDGNLAVDVE